MRKAGPIRVLDIAAGHGLYGVTIARQNPQAEIVAVDWAPVLEVAKENAAAQGVSSRLRTIAGDAMKVDLGSNYDLVLVTNFLHHFDEHTNLAFLKRIRAAVREGGRVAALEFVPDENRVTPRPAGCTEALERTRRTHLQKTLRGCVRPGAALHPAHGRKHKALPFSSSLSLQFVPGLSRAR